MLRYWIGFVLCSRWPTALSGGNCRNIAISLTVVNESNRLITFYKKNVKENISPTTGHRPDIQPLYVSTRLWFASLVALVGRTKACGGSEFLWRSHRRLTTKPIRSETNKHNGCQMPTMILSGTQGPSLFRIVREGLGSTRRLGAEAHGVYVTS